MSDPNVTIIFSGQGDGAIRASVQVGAALDSLAVKSKSARNALQQVGQVMDLVSAKAVSVSKIGAAYSQASAGIDESVKASQRGTAAFTKMAEAAAGAQAQVSRLGKTGGGAAQSKGGGSGQEAALMGAAGVGSLSKMAMQAAGVTIGLAAIGNEMRKLIGASSDLDKAMSAVAAVGALEKTSQVYGELIELVTDLGGKTQYSATEAATGLKELIAAGYSAADAAKLLADTLSLAATENMEMGRASEIVVASLQSFQMGVDQSTRVTDVLARAANASTASIDGMGEALKYLAPVANALKIPIEDAAASVAIMSNNGVQAGLAGRGLSAIIARMIAPSKDAQEVIAKFGLTLADLNPQVVGLGGAFKNLQRVDTAGLVKLFGAENLDVSNIAKANADSFGEMTDRMKDVSITAKGMATLKNDNLAGDFKKAAAAVNLLRIELAKDLYARLRKYVESFTNLLRNNKAEIVEGIKKLVDLVEVVGKVGLAYVAVRSAMAAVKGISLVPQLLQTAAAFGASSAAAGGETVALEANTVALLGNRTARTSWMHASKAGTMSRAGAGGAAVGAVVGASMIKEGEGAAMSSAKVVGGAVAGALAVGFGAALVGKLSGVILAGAAVVKTVLATALTGAVQFAVAGLSVASLGVFAVIAAGGASLIYNYDRASKAANEATDAVGELGNAMTANATNSIREAKTQAELDKAKAKIKNDLISAEGQLAGMKRMGSKDQDLQSVQTTVDGLRRVLGLSDAVFANNQKAAQLAAEEAQWAEDNAKFKAAAAEAAQKEAVAMANMVEAAGKLKERLPELGEKILGTLPAAEQLAMGNARSGSAVADTNALRGPLEAALAGAKVDLSLIDPNREIKTVDDVIAYYRAIIGAVQSSGKGDLLGLEQVTALTTALEKAMDAKTLVAAKQKEMDQAAKESAKNQQELAKVHGEIAINEAKAAGDTEKANRLERERKILEEQNRLVELMGKGKDAEAKALAIKKVNAEAAANASAKADSLRGMAVTSLQEMGGGGRVFAGGFGDNRQVDLLGGILGVLNQINAKGANGGMTVQKI